MQLFDSYALLIGAGKLPAQLSSLPAANINAETLYQTLTIQNGYRVANTFRLTSADATRAQILAQVKRCLPPVVRPSTLLLFYFSGYGCLERSTGRYYFLPADVDPRSLASTALPVETLAAALDALPASRRLVILDCNPLTLAQLEQWDKACGPDLDLVPPPPEVLRLFCQAGEPTRSAERMRSAEPVHRGERAVISSAENQQLSIIDRFSGGSLFTATLIDILSGEVAGIKAGPLQLDTLANSLVQQVTHTAFQDYDRDQRPALLTGGQHFPVALIFGTAKGAEAEDESSGRKSAEDETYRGARETHGQHAKPLDHSDRPSDRPKEESAWDESLSFGIGGDALDLPVMRGDPGAKGAESAPPTTAINAGDSKGFVNQPEGTVEQNYGTQINTGGGTAINGNVNTNGGDMAGHDVIKNNVTAQTVVILSNEQGARIGDNLGLLKQPEKITGQLSLKLWVAAPKRVYVHEAFQIATAIQMPQSPAPVVPDLPNKTEGRLNVLRTDQPYIQLRIKIHESSSYRVIGSDFYDIVYTIGADSALYYFELEPLQPGKIYIIIEVIQSLGSIGSTRVMMSSAARKKAAGRVVTEVESQAAPRLEDVLAALNLLAQQVRPAAARDQAAMAIRSLVDEAHLGSQANDKRVKLWLGVLENVSPEVWKAALAAFSRPIEGVDPLVRKVVEGELAQVG